MDARGSRGSGKGERAAPEGRVGTTMCKRWAHVLLLLDLGEQLLEPPYVYVFNRVKDEMQRIALEGLLEEELRQDEQEGGTLHL